MRKIAIIGGGPAGAIAAEKLARAGATVSVFEERPHWEKPCGGGVSHKALERYPFLLKATGALMCVREAQLVAAKGVSLFLRLREPLAVYSRLMLNNLLLRRAEEAGAETIQDRILSFNRAGSGWRLEGRGGTYCADYLALAAGARSRLRRLLTEDFQACDFMLTFGYYVPRSDNLLRVQFFEDFEGYAWAFPRPDHLSVGICGKAGANYMSALQERLHGFMDKFGYPAESAPVFSHLLPSLSVESWSNLRLAGRGWALVGDAGGLVDPITGEGIYYAMRSGELFAETLIQDSPASYPERVWREFGARLALGARLSPLFYRGDFLGASVTTRMVEFAARSGSFINLLQDLMEGSQSYAGLAARLYRGLPRSLGQMLAGSLRDALCRPRFPESSLVSAADAMLRG